VFLFVICCWKICYFFWSRKCIYVWKCP